jgi:hypothetical protein
LGIKRTQEIKKKGFKPAKGDNSKSADDKGNKPAKGENSKSAEDMGSKTAKGERNKRIAIRFAIITAFLVISFAAQSTYQVVIVTWRYFYPRRPISKLEDVVMKYFSGISTVNGILNPFIYFFMDA